MKDPKKIEELVVSCRRLYASIDRLDHEAARAAGVSRNELRALNALERGPVRAGHLAEVMSMTTGAVSTLIDRLEARGLVRRRHDPADRRAVLVEPTDEMFLTLAPIYKRVAAQLRCLAEGYSQRELRAALRHLGDVIAAYECAVTDASAPT